MANQLTNAQVITPDAQFGSTADNILTAAYAGYASKPFVVDGVEYGVEDVNLLLAFVLNGATLIELYFEAASFDAPTVWHPCMKDDAVGASVVDLLTIDSAKLLAGQVTIERGWHAKGQSRIRVRARATGGASPTLDVKVTAGGGGGLN